MSEHKKIVEHETNIVENIEKNLNYKTKNSRVNTYKFGHDI